MPSDASPLLSLPADTSFEELARLPDEELDVALGAALVARDAYPDLDVSALLEALGALGAPAPSGESARARPLTERVTAVSERFIGHGFRGNTEEYYDPRNSLLSDVLSRRLGLPITLSIVWCAMARNSGLLARGVAFPGHFLVRVDDAATGPDEQAPVIVDPFEEGRILDDHTASALLARALGPAAALHPALFAPASPRAVLVRLLTNLEATYAKRGDNARAFIAVDRMLTLVPHSTRMLRERAALAVAIRANEVARADLARVLEMEPHAPDRPQIEARLASLEAPARGMLQ